MKFFYSFLSGAFLAWSFYLAVPYLSNARALGLIDKSIRNSQRIQWESERRLNQEEPTIEQRYAKLEAEMIAALTANKDLPDDAARASKEVYKALFIDGASLAPSLAALLKERKDEKVRVAENQWLSFQGFGEILSVDCAKVLQSHLIDSSLSRAKAKRFLAKGGDPFAAFTGSWDGTYYQGVTQQTEADGQIGTRGDYKHEWQETKEIESRWLMQPVFITDKSNHSLTVAVNSASKETGEMVGAVEYNKKITRPHAGYFVDPSTILWVVAEPNGTRAEPRFSFFFEHITPQRVYLLLGVQFRWSRAAQKLIFEQFMGGSYQAPTPPM
jgi:hypothetical protein